MELLLLLVCFVLAFRLLRWLELPVLWAWILGAIAAVVLPVALVTFLNGILASIVASPLLALLLGLLLALLAGGCFLGWRVLRDARLLRSRR